MAFPITLEMAPELYNHQGLFLFRGLTWRFQQESDPGARINLNAKSYNTLHDPQKRANEVETIFRASGLEGLTAAQIRQEIGQLASRLTLSFSRELSQLFVVESYGKNALNDINNPGIRVIASLQITDPMQPVLLLLEPQGSARRYFEAGLFSNPDPTQLTFSVATVDSNKYFFEDGYLRAYSFKSNDQEIRAKLQAAWGNQHSRPKTEKELDALYQALTKEGLLTPDTEMPRLVALSQAAYILRRGFEKSLISRPESFWTLLEQNDAVQKLQPVLERDEETFGGYISLVEEVWRANLGHFKKNLSSRARRHLQQIALRFEKTGTIERYFSLGKRFELIQNLELRWTQAAQSIDLTLKEE